MLLSHGLLPTFAADGRRVEVKAAVPRTQQAAPQHQAVVTGKIFVGGTVRVPWHVCGWVWVWVGGCALERAVPSAYFLALH